MHSKESHKQNKKKQPLEWEKIFANEEIDKVLISQVYKQLTQLNTKKKIKQPNENMGRRSNRHFSRRFTDGQEIRILHIFYCLFFIELFYIVLLFWPYHGACEDFSFTISDPNPCVSCLNHWTTRAVHTLCNCYSYMSSFLPEFGPLVSQMVKNLPAMQETLVLSLGREDPLEKGMATHSSILA